MAARVSSPLTFRIFICCLTAFALGACGGGEPLTYDAAMNLMRDRSDPVRINFSAAPRFSNDDARLARAYQKLLDGRIIQCKNTASLGVLCEPGVAGDALTQNSVTELSMVAGRWVASAIVTLQRTGRSSATADVRVSFEASPTYRDFGDALDLIQPPGYMVAQASWKQGKVVHVNFQRYEDGWHIESVTD
jgi:hypothetical protein